MESLFIQANAHAVFVAGDFSHTLEAGRLTLAGTADTSAFLVSLNPVGNFTSARSIDGTADSSAIPLSLAIDASGNAYPSASYSGTVVVGGKTFASDVGSLVARFSPPDASPTIFDPSRASTIAAAVTTASVNPAGDLSLAGGFVGNLTFAGLHLNAPPGMVGAFVLLHAPPRWLFPGA